MASFNTGLSFSETLMSFKSTSVKSANRQLSSAGYTMSFPSATVIKKIFTFTLGFLSSTEKSTIQTFFDTNQGTTFTVDFSVTGDTTVYTVIFDQDEIEFEYMDRASEKYIANFKMREV